MSVSTTIDRVTYASDNSTTAFSFPYVLFANGDLKVYLKNNTTGAETLRTITTHYTISGTLTNGVYESGVTVNFLTAPTSSETVLIYRDRSVTQDLELDENGKIPSLSLEKQLDKLTTYIQRVKNKLARSVGLPEGFTATFSPELPPVMVEDGYLKTNTAGDGFEYISEADLIGVLQVGGTGFAADRALQTDADGDVESSAVTSTELGYLSGVTSAVQTQINSKQNTITGAASTIVTNDLTANRVVISNVSGKITTTNVTHNEVDRLSGVTDAVSGNNQSATLQNKTLVAPSTDVVLFDGQAATPSSPSAGNYRVYVKDSTQKLTVLNSSGVETTVGSGSGLKNYITNGDAEAGTTGWSTYADAAGTRPVDGTGGTPDVTWTTSGTNPLEGVSSFIFTKDAVNRQGQGASFDFEIDLADEGRVLNIEFDYLVNSGTFVAGTSSADSDVIVYLYDKDNSRLLEPSSIKLLSNNATIADRFRASFQSASDSNSYRLILHCATTSASAYSLKIDNVKVTQSTYALGTPVTDWTQYTPTFNGFGTPTSVECFYRRVGSDLEISATFTSGTSTAVEARVGLPAGFTSQGSPRIVNIQVAGSGGFSVAGANQYIPLIEPSVTYLTLGIQSATAAALTKIASTNSYVASGQRLSFTARVPIVGLSSSVQMSADADTRIVLATATGNPASASATNPIIFPTTSIDTHGGYNSTTGRYTSFTSGFFRIAISSTTTSPASSVALNVYKNGTIDRVLGQIPTSAIGFAFNTILQLNSGDIVDIRPTAALDINDGTIMFERISGPSAIAANELIAVQAENSSGQSVASGSQVVVTNWTSTLDTHGSFNASTGIFTAPNSGSFEFSVMTTFADTTAVGDRQVHIRDVTNASNLANSLRPYNTVGSGLTSLCATYIKRLRAGDQISIHVQQNAGVSQSLSAVANRNTLSIKRLGF